MFSTTAFKVYITRSFVIMFFCGDFGIYIYEKQKTENPEKIQFITKKEANKKRKRNIKSSANSVTVCYD